MFHFYADDFQIYFSFDSNTPELVTASRSEACVKDARVRGFSVFVAFGRDTLSKQVSR